MPRGRAKRCRGRPKRGAPPPPPPPNPPPSLSPPARRTRASTSGLVEPPPTLPEPQRAKSRAKAATRGRRGTAAAPKTVKCMKCSESVPSATWAAHNYQSHNNLAWKEGEAMIDETDEALVKRIYGAIIKGNRLLRCQLCKETKKSVQGFLSHQLQCSKSDEELTSMRVQCQLCQRTMLPVSMYAHMQVHKAADAAAIKQQELAAIQESSPSGTRRRAATKALEKFTAMTSHDADNSDNDGDGDGKGTKKSGINLFRLFKPLATFRKIRSTGMVRVAYNNELATNGRTICRNRSCTFVAQNLQQIVDHQNDCPEIPEKAFICVTCWHGEDTQQSIIDHLKSCSKRKHAKKTGSGGDDESNDDDNAFDDSMKECSLSSSESSDDNDYSEKKKRNATSSSAAKIVPNFPRFDFLNHPTSCSAFYKPSQKWHDEFCKANYSDLLFNDCFTTNWTAVTAPDDYLPTLRLSVPVAFPISRHVHQLHKMEHNWRQVGLHEATVENEVVTLFCGGPVYALAWLPTPSAADDQYLAVSVHRSPDDVYPLDDTRPRPGAVQFWNFGKLWEKDKPATSGTCDFLLAHNHGAVWCMEWCPSGCHNRQPAARLGLLALACSDGCVWIYAIAKPDMAGSSGKPAVLKARPCFQLGLDWTQSTARSHATKMTWSQLQGHSVVAAGFGDGTIGLWNLQTTSSLQRRCNKESEDGTAVVALCPYLSFPAHKGPVTALSIHPTDNDRYLFSGSWDKSAIFWDLLTLLPVSQTTRNCITDGVWPLHWTCSITAFDDSYGFKTSSTLLQSVRHVYKPLTYLHANSCVNSLAWNNWLNGCAQATTGGELMAAFPQQMFVGLDTADGLKRRRYLLALCDVIDRHLPAEERQRRHHRMRQDMKMCSATRLGEGEMTRAIPAKLADFDEQPFNYDAAVERFGLVFVNWNQKIGDRLPSDVNEMCQRLDHMRRHLVDRHPLQAMTRTSWNPNRPFSRFIAVGSRSGFVHVKWVGILR